MTIYGKIGPVCESYGKKGAGDRRAQRRWPPPTTRSSRYVEQTNLDDHRQGVLRRELHLRHRGKACGQMPLYQEADMVFGVGGGKALDTVKCLCIDRRQAGVRLPHHRLQLRRLHLGVHHVQRGRHLSAAATSLYARSCTPLSTQRSSPKAPSQYMWAGIGDTYAKYYEATISSRDERLEHFTALGVAVSSHVPRPAARTTADSAFGGPQTGACAPTHVEQVVLAIVVTTGIASIFLTKDLHAGLQQRPGPRGVLCPDLLPCHRGTAPPRRGGGLRRPAGAAGGRPVGRV